MNATRPLTSLASYSYHTVFALIAIALAAVAQYAHVYRQADQGAALLFLAALFFWAAAVVLAPIQIVTRLDESAAPARTHRPRWLFAAGAAALSLITFVTATNNTFTLDNVSAWLLSIATFLYAFWEPEKNWDEWRASLAATRQRLTEGLTGGFQVPAKALLLMGILLVGIFFYYHNLDGVPGEMDSDHAEKILDVNDVVNGGVRPIFFERNTGREPMEFYMIAVLVEFGRHPIDHMALKLVTATMGLLVIPGTFFFARELFEDSVALLAAALIAISKWPVTIARMGLRFPFTPVFIAPLAFFLFRACKYKRRNDFLMAGLFLGAGLFGYNAFRIAPVLAAAFLILWPLVGKNLTRDELRRYVANGLLVFALAFIVFMPLLRYSLDHPENFWYRVLTRLSTEERTAIGNPVATLASNSVTAALMFNWTGDVAWPNSIPGDPALDYVSGGLFLFGVAYALYRLIRFREWAFGFVLLGTAILLLPTALSLAFPIENPSNVRAGGAIPFVFVLAALPLAWLFRSLRQSWSTAGAVAFLVVFLAIVGRVNYERYFHDFSANYLQSSWNSSEVARVIRGFADSVGDDDHAYILLYPHWIDTRNVAINMGKIGWDQTLPNANAAAAQGTDGANRLYILNLSDAGNLGRLQELFPNGQLRVFHSNMPGHDFNLWYVPGTISPDVPLTSR